jgi:translation initiation factor 3 subunit G
VATLGACCPQDLFCPFGPVSRIYLATDRITGESRGFAFVNYQRREDAERAIKVLNGYGYAHLVLQVDWAQPRAERPG